MPAPEPPSPEKNEKDENTVTYHIYTEVGTGKWKFVYILKIFLLYIFPPLINMVLVVDE